MEVDVDHERGFRGEQDGHERPLDWQALASRVGVPEPQARMLHDEAIRWADAHREQPRNIEAIYVELLERARQRARRPSPGKITRTMRPEAERNGRHPGSRAALRSGQRIAPGKCTLTSYLQRTEFGSHAVEQARAEDDPATAHGNLLAADVDVEASALPSNDGQDRPVPPVAALHNPGSGQGRGQIGRNAWSWQQNGAVMPSPMIAAAGPRHATAEAPVPAAAEEQALRLEGGQPLPEAVRRPLEQRFGVSLDRVRIHIDATAQDAVNALGVSAFTVGEHIFFGPGQLAFDTPEGMKLLAHEVTHVVQYGQGRLAHDGEGVGITDPADSVEQEAVATGAAVASETMADADKEPAKAPEDGIERRGVMRAELADAASEDGVVVQQTAGQPALLVPDEEPENPEAQAQAAGTPGEETAQAEPAPEDQGAETAYGAGPAIAGPSAADTTEQAAAEAESASGAKTPPGAPSTLAQVAPSPEIESTARTMQAHAAETPSPAAIRGAFPDTAPSFEEFWQTVSSGRNVDEDRGQASQLAASLEASAALEQATLQAAASAQKAEIQGLADAQVAVIEGGLAQQTAAVRDSHATARETLRSSAEQRKADMASQLAAEIAQVQASTTAAVASAEAELEQRRSGFLSFIESQRQQAEMLVESEIQRTNVELDAAADEAIAVGEAEASQRSNGDARNAARQLAAESAADIRAKKGDIAGDLHARVAELSAKYDEYAQNITAQIDEIRGQLVPAIEDRAPHVIAQLEQGHASAAENIDGVVAQREQALQTSETAAVANLEQDAQATISQVQGAAAKLGQGVDAIVEAIVERQGQLAHGMAAAIREEEEPNLPGVEEAVAGTRAQLAALSNTGHTQLDELRASTSESLARITAGFSERSSALVARAGEQAEACVSAALSTMEETGTARQEAAQTSIDGLEATHVEMVSTTLAELDPAIEAARGEVQGVTQQFRDEITQATDQSIAEAKKPRTDPLEGRVAEAADQAEESWFSGLLRAIGDIVVGLVVLVVVALVVAAVAAMFGVLLTAWAAMMIAGAILLVVGLAASLYMRWNQPELVDAPWWQRVGLAIMDTTGITGMIQAGTGTDLVTGETLSAGERTHQGVTGTFTFVMLILGVRAAFKGPPGGVWTRNPGMPRGWVGWRSAIPEGLRGARNVAFELYTGMVESGRRGVEWLRERFGEQSHAPSEPALPERPQQQPGESRESYLNRLKEWRRQQLGSEQYQERFSEETINEATNEIQDPDHQRWFDQATLRERQLAYDPAHEGSITDQGIREAQVGIEAERQGLVEEPLRRSTNAGEEFVDGSGQAWDVKRPDNPSSIVDDLIAGENILIDGDLSPAQYEALLRDVASEYTTRGMPVPSDLGARVVSLQHGYTGAPPVVPAESPESEDSEEAGDGP